MQHPPPTPTLPAQAPPPLTWVFRVAVMWGDAVVDVVTVAPGASATHQLRSGMRLSVVTPDLQHGDKTPLHVQLDGVDHQLFLHQTLSLPSGHTIVAGLDSQSPRFRWFTGLDSAWTQAIAVSAAVHVLAIAAFLMTPQGIPDESGAGLYLGETDWVVPDGTGKPAQAPIIVVSGRVPDPAERVFQTFKPQVAPPIHKAGPQTVPVRIVKGPHLKQGAKEAVGADVDRQPTADNDGHTSGGFVKPKEPPTGNGPGLAGIGPSANAKQTPGNTRQVIPLTPDSQLPESPQPNAKKRRRGRRDLMDPDIRREILSRIQSRRNLVESCYESWALMGDHKAKGRVVLSLLLAPDGYVETADAHAPSHLRAAADCITRHAADWYLAPSGLDQSVVLRVPYRLRPRPEQPPAPKTQAAS